MNAMRRFLLSLCTAVSILLAACGGGGGGDAPAVAKVNVGGILAGLGAGKSVVIADASGPTASLSANGSYSLSMPAGTTYSLRVQAQPSGQTCTISNGTGTANAHVNNISVNCADNTIAPEAKVVSGTIAGLGTGKTVVLQLNAQDGIQETTVNANGSFQFPEPVVGTYTITVKTAPTGQTCTVATTGGITVTCAASSFKLSGTVSGNIGVVSIRNAANGDTVTMNANGAFTFTQPVLQGGSYSVGVFDQSAGQTCGVTGGSGTANADVGNIQVSCTAVVVVAPPIPVPAVPVGLPMTYGVKRFILAWGAVTAPVGGGAVSYRVFEDPDGAGPAASTQIAGSLAGTTYTHTVTGLLHTRLNAQYTVQACNSGGCSLPTAAITPNVSQAIGYFKASNTDAADNFGSSVALSADGSTLAVGAQQEQSHAMGINGNQNDNTGSSGAVYIFTRTGAGWSQQAYVKASNTGSGDFFGSSVALSADGSTLAVGAHRERSIASGIDGNQADDSAVFAGAAYVFTRTAGNWSQQAYVKASNARASSAFGYHLQLAADGNTLAIGAPQESSNATGVNGNQTDTSMTFAGAVYVFTRSGTVWSQQAYLKASNTQADSEFGGAVALSADGTTLAVGASTEDSNATGINGNQADTSLNAAGAVYVFTRTGATWTQQAYVKASNTRASALFGVNLALSADGSTLAVDSWAESSNATGIGGSQADTGTTNAGAVYVFTRAAGAWSQQAYVKASNTRANAEFSRGLALSSDGNKLAVGSRYETSGATGINGNQADTSAANAGAVYLFTRTGAAWSQQAYIKASNTGAGDTFGSRLALSADGTTLAVAAAGEGSQASGIDGNQADNSASNAGAVYLY
jgi:HJR/Mrr/RecB family endonuclease